MLSSCCTLVFEKAQQNFRRLVRKRRQAFVRLPDKGIGFLDKAVSCGDAQRPVEMMKPRLKNPLNREGSVGEVRPQWGLKLRHASNGSTAWVVHCYMYMRAVLETVEDRSRIVVVVQVERIGRLFNKETGNWPLELCWRGGLRCFWGSDNKRHRRCGGHCTVRLDSTFLIIFCLFPLPFSMHVSLLLLARQARLVDQG